MTLNDGQTDLLNPQARYGSCDNELLDLRRSFEERVAHSAPSVLFGVVL